MASTQALGVFLSTSFPPLSDTALYALNVREYKPDELSIHPDVDLYPKTRRTPDVRVRFFPGDGALTRTLNSLLGTSVVTSVGAHGYNQTDILWVPLQGFATLDLRWKLRALDHAKMPNSTSALYRSALTDGTVVNRYLNIVAQDERYARRTYNALTKRQIAAAVAIHPFIHRDNVDTITSNILTATT